MELIGKLKAAARKARRKVRPRTPYSKGMTAADLWFCTHRVTEPEAERAGVARANKRLAAVRENHPPTDPNRPASRQQLRRALRKWDILLGTF